MLKGFLFILRIYHISSNFCNNLSFAFLQSLLHRKIFNTQKLYILYCLLLENFKSQKMTKLKKLHISLNLTNFVPCQYMVTYCRRHLHHLHVTVRAA